SPRSVVVAEVPPCPEQGLEECSLLAERPDCDVAMKASQQRLEVFRLEERGAVFATEPPVRLLPDVQRLLGREPIVTAPMASRGPAAWLAPVETRPGTGLRSTCPRRHSEQVSHTGQAVGCGTAVDAAVPPSTPRRRLRRARGGTREASSAAALLPPTPPI